MKYALIDGLLRKKILVKTCLIDSSDQLTRETSLMEANSVNSVTQAVILL